MSIITRVANRYLLASAPDLEELQEGLATLKELDANLQAIEDAFGAHFTMTASVLKPEVKSQFDALAKAKEGLKAAREIQKHADVILSLEPSDKTAQRTKVEADRMVDRFSRHEEAARKIIRTISKKEMPSNLKKVAAAATKLIEDQLADPSALEVIPWQNTVNLWNDISGRMVEVVMYQMVFQIKGAEEYLPYRPLLVEYTSTKAGVYARTEGPGEGTLTNSREFAAYVLERLKGWSGLKGAAGAAATRTSTADEVAKIITSVCERLGWDSDRAQVSQDKTRIQGAYRSNLPKEGAYSVGEYEYERMEREEIARCRTQLAPLLQPYKDLIERAHIQAEEKSWIYIEVTLR